jgi:hypothetical protein
MIKLKIINNLREGKKKIKKEKTIIEKIITRITKKVRLNL